MNVYVEIFGYIGTALVILSMTMTSMVRLRVINICGGIISLFYSLYYGAWAMVVMNACLISINIVQIILALRHKATYSYHGVSSEEAAVSVFLSENRKEIDKYAPSLSSLVYSGAQVNMIYSSGEAVGIVVSEREKDNITLLADYVVQKNRNAATGNFLLSALKEQGALCLKASAGSKAHEKYLLKLGFQTKEGQLSRTL